MDILKLFLAVSMFFAFMELMVDANRPEYFPAIKTNNIQRPV